METNRTFMLVVGVRTPGSPFECARSMGYFTRLIHSVVAAAAFINAVLLAFFGPPGAFLNAANQFVLLAFHELQSVVRKLREFLFQLALGDVPISFGGKYAHTIFPFGCALPSRGLTQHDFLLQVACRPVVGPVVPSNPSICRPPKLPPENEWPGILQTATRRLASCIIRKDGIVADGRFCEQTRINRPGTSPAKRKVK